MYPIAILFSYFDVKYLKKGCEQTESGEATMYGRASLGLLQRKMVFSNLCFNYIADGPSISRKVRLTQNRY